MTETAMRRQLYHGISSAAMNANPGNQLEQFLINVFYPLINEEEGTDQDKIKYLFDNLERPLLEKIYNYTWSLENDEEDINHINNSMYFTQPEVSPTTSSGGKKTKKKTKKKQRKNKEKKDKLI